MTGARREWQEQERNDKNKKRMTETKQECQV
jgi:hypothetical protein